MKRFSSKSRTLRHESLETRQMLDASGLPAGEPVADFQLKDVNPTSPTFDLLVSPRDTTATKAFYFIHST